jgi:hypothetical protein
MSVLNHAMIREVSKEYFVQETNEAGQGIKLHYSKFTEKET